MGTVYQVFLPADGVPPSSAYATPDYVMGTGSPTPYPVPCLDFDQTNDEAVFFYFRAVNYGSGSLTIDIDWYADTETSTSADVVWEAQIGCIAPNTDTDNIEAMTLGTLNYVQDTHLGTTGQRLHRATITLSNTDGIAAGSWCVLRIARDGNSTNATDDLAGDASLVMVTISYSDT